MRILVALLLPPVAVLLCGRVVQAIINLVLCCTVVFYPLAMVHAVLCVVSHGADRRTERIVRAIQGRRVNGCS